MIQKEDRWIMEEIFRLSDQALVRMINGLFGTEYQDEEKIWKEWRDQEALSVCLKVGGMNRYEFSLRRLDGCLQICAENRGNIFVYEKMAVGDVMQIREPQILYFGKNHREEYSRTLEFPGKERVELPIRVITLEDCSARKLEENGIYTMGDIARCSLGRSGDFYNEDLLFRLFGINAELLIDHAWGYEPCTIADIKAYKPQDKSIGSGQVLHCPCDFNQAKLVLKEMADMLAMDLVDKGLIASQIVLTVGYDIENLTDPVRRKAYKGAVTTDQYGRKIPKHAHGTIHLKLPTSSARLIMQGAMELYDGIVDKNLLIRRLYITAEHAMEEKKVQKQETYEQLSLFTDYEAVEKEREKEVKNLEKEKRLQQAMLDIKKKYGKNAILKGMNLEEGATAIERNRQIGGHKA